MVMPTNVVVTLLLSVKYVVALHVIYLVKEPHLKYTNKFNLPQPVADAISRDTYIRGDNNYSVTELIESPRIVQLKRRHWEELTEDVIDSVWSIFGSAVHNIMESHASDESFVEQRYYIERLGRKVGGMIDCFNNGIISDYKVTSAWSIVYGSRKEHWTQQLNLYAHIMRSNGIEVKGLQIVTFLRDWDRNKAKQDYTYPQVPLLVMPIELWSESEAEAYLLERLELHINNETYDDQELHYCSESETWAKGDKYAVGKYGAKRATKVFDTEEDAKDYMKGTDLCLQKRPGLRTRCAEYCSLSGLCSQYQEFLTCSEE